MYGRCSVVTLSDVDLALHMLIQVYGVLAGTIYLITLLLATIGRRSPDLRLGVE